MEELLPERKGQAGAAIANDPQPQTSRYPRLARGHSAPRPPTTPPAQQSAEQRQGWARRDGEELASEELLSLIPKPHQEVLDHGDGLVARTDQWGTSAPETDALGGEPQSAGAWGYESRPRIRHWKSRPGIPRQEPWGPRGDLAVRQTIASDAHAGEASTSLSGGRSARAQSLTLARAAPTWTDAFGAPPHFNHRPGPLLVPVAGRAGQPVEPEPASGSKSGRPGAIVSGAAGGTSRSAPLTRSNPPQRVPLAVTPRSGTNGRQSAEGSEGGRGGRSVPAVVRRSACG